MRKFFAFVILFACIQLNAQTVAKARKVVELFPQQDFFLNGGFRGNFGGVSRQIFKIVLPPGTVEWYYTVTTSASTPNQSINLVPQLTKLLDPTGTTAILASAILAPTGANAVECLLMPIEEQTSFLQMKEANSIRRYASDSRQNFRSGTVQVRDIIMPGTYVLGFRNPSVTAGVGVSFAAAAIVEDVPMNPNSDKAVNYGNLAWAAYESGDIMQCIDYSKKALELDNTLGYVKANLGLCYLIQENEPVATDYYIDALADFKKMPDKKRASSFISAAIKDITDRQRRRPALIGGEKIKTMYQAALVRLTF